MIDYIDDLIDGMSDRIDRLLRFLERWKGGMKPVNLDTKSWERLKKQNILAGKRETKWKTD